jgi:hypothetical protein
MAKQAAGKVYANAQDLVAGVAKETGVKPDDVRKVLRASFASTKDFILQQLAEAQSGPAGKQELGDKDLEKVAGGIILQKEYLATPGFSLFLRRYSVSPSIGEKIGSLGP